MPKKYTKAQKAAYAKRMAKKKNKSRHFGYKRRYNAGTDLMMLRNPLNVRKTATLKMTYLNSCILPSQAFDLDAVSGKMNVAIQFYLNSPYIFPEGGATPAGSNIRWSRGVVDHYSSTTQPDMVRSYHEGDNWSYKYKTGIVLGHQITVNARVLRDPSSSDDGTTCPVAVHLTRQTIGGLLQNKTPEQIKDRPYTISKFLGSDSKEKASGVNLTQNHSSAKFNGLSGHYKNDGNWTFDTGGSSNGNNGTGSIPLEGDYANLVLTPVNSAMVDASIGRINSPQVMFSIKITKIIRFSEPSVADNQPQPLV